MAGTFTTKHANGIVANAKATILTPSAGQSFIGKIVEFFNAHASASRTLRLYTDDGSSIQFREISIPPRKTHVLEYFHLEATHKLEADDSGAGGTDINWKADYFLET